MLLTNLRRFILAGVVLAMFSNCSTDDEVSQQQLPQSRINAALRQQIEQNTNESIAVETFQSQINWYDNLNPSTCNVSAMLLAFEVFDANGTSLNVISIFPWDVQSFGTLENSVNQQIQLLNAEYQQEVTLVFTSGILFKENAANQVTEFAQVNSFDLFLDYFNNCQSDDVIFQPNTTGVNEWILFPPPTSPGDVTFPEEPCFTYVYPLNLTVVNNNVSSQPYQVTVNNQEELLGFFAEENPAITIIDFVYPLTLATSDNTQVTVNNALELEQLFAQPCN